MTIDLPRLEPRRARWLRLAATDQVTMASRNRGKLAAFELFAIIAALVIAAVGAALDVPWWAIAVTVFACLLGVAWALRRQQTGRWSYERRSWFGEQDGRSVELVFDEKGVVLNRLALIVDGEQVDRDTIFYRTKKLSGAGVTVEVGSGWIGQCTGVVLQGSSGEERPLSERATVWSAASRDRSPRRR